ncbi:MAG: Holliday junction resolvase RuvX [Saprospiraceae bacterium]|nr:Holliday junction resolvase RuvX [Saprospiraceae bacterium]
MGRILGIDYGEKKIGVAVTDPLQLIVTGLPTISNSDLIPFLSEYVANQDVEEIVLGLPHHPDGNPAQLAETIQKLGAVLQQEFPTIAIRYQDESYTSREARQIILQSGASRKKRRDKHLVDKISAVLILQNYLKHY